MNIPTAILFETEDFMVIGPEQQPAVPASEWVFELVRKIPSDDKSPEVLFCYGFKSAIMQAKIKYWQVNTPQQAEVEAFIDGMMQLGAISLKMQ